MKKMLLLFLFCSSVCSAAPAVFPPPMKKGDLIALVFPAACLDEGESQEILSRKLKWLYRQGYRARFFPLTIKAHGYLAGTDEERAAALMDAWRDPEVKAIWCFRGGWGSARMMGLLDYEWIKRHPKIFIGMSDITALHHAIQQETGLVTFLAPVLHSFEEKESDFDANYAFSALERVVVSRKAGLIRFPTAGIDSKVIRAGKARGRLVGGNLALIASMCGTRWQLETEDKILLLEDVGEDIYRIDRMLWQIKEAGLLDSPAAVILCSWKNCKSKSKNSLTLEEVFHHYFKDAHYPVISGFPSGHDRYQTTVPLNVLAEVDAETMRVELLEAAVSSGVVGSVVTN